MLVRNWLQRTSVGNWNLKVSRTKQTWNGEFSQRSKDEVVQVSRSPCTNAPLTAHEPLKLNLLVGTSEDTCPIDLYIRESTQPEVSS